MTETRGLYRALFAAVLLFLDGTLNIIYGFAGIGDATLFHHPTHYVVGTLDSWGWVSLGLGVLQIVAAGSLVLGHRHTFGRYFAIAVGALSAIAALLDIQAEPHWSLAVFAISIWIIWGVATYRDGTSSSGQGQLRAEDEFAVPSDTIPQYTPRPIG